MKINSLFEQGTFFLGCNYWASHAGTNMWHVWKEEIIEEDFKRLSDSKINVLRIFPLWPDFQPLKLHRKGGGSFGEIRMGEDALPFTEEGKAGVSSLMADRFDIFLKLAEKYNLKLVVGLLTGWMSGRLYVPELMEGINVLTNPLAIKWEIKFVKYMVKRFKNHPAILAWDLGNECNCMGHVGSDSEAYVWTQTITMAIKTEDTTHPVISGMHSLNPNGVWRPLDQGEVFDILCTHPYPIFTPHCDTDPINRMKSALHAAAESRFYADLGNKPCFAEEAGTLGPMISSETLAADYVNSSLFTLWAHDCRGFMWWCANEQIELTHTPYDWNSVERELGLFRVDGTKKPVLNTMTAFARFIESFEYDLLPPAITDAVCILTKGQDTWAAAYGGFILAKQAGLDIEFAFCDDEIRQSSSYILPSLSGDASLSRHTLFDLLERVKNGATLYLSIDNALISPFSEFTGLKVITREKRTEADKIIFDGSEFNLFSEYKLTFESVGAKILAENQNGNPIFAVNDYGKGKVYTISHPIEKIMATHPSITDGKNESPIYKFYNAINIRNPLKCAVKDIKTVGVTEHIINENKRLLTVINYEPFEQSVNITIDNDFKLAKCHSIKNDIKAMQEDNVLSLDLPHNNGVIIEIIR